MSSYTVYLNDSTLEKAFLSFIRSLSIKHSKAVIETDIDCDRIIPPKVNGNPTMLFGKWKNFKLDAKELRTTSWRRDIF